MGEWLWPVLALTEVALLVGYVVLFLVRKDVSLRPRTFGAIQSIGVLAQLALLIEQLPSPASNVVVALLCRFIVMILFLTLRGVCHVHARADSVRAEIEEACRRLFISKEEPRPGELHLSAKGMTVVVRLWAMGPLTLILFSRPPGANKLTLFFDWLLKRYPGPIPRIRVSLNRR